MSSVSPTIRATLSDPEKYLSTDEMEMVTPHFMEQFIEQGIEKGIEKGKAIGKAEGKAEATIQLLQKFMLKYPLMSDMEVAESFGIELTWVLKARKTL
jgi:flagellar biosynthesis/type III secretory pathway protein FliH